MSPVWLSQVLDEAFALLGPDIVMAHAKDLVRDGHAGNVAAGMGLLDYGHYLRHLAALSGAGGAGFGGALILHSLNEAQVPESIRFLRGKLEAAGSGVSVRADQHAPPGGLTMAASEYGWQAVRDDDAPFAPRDGGGALSLGGRMWLLGGWNPQPEWAAHFPRVCNSEVWSSTDGATWNLVLAQAPWEGRHCAGYVVHAGKMWVVGGDCNQGHYQHDVWCSKDGIEWRCVCYEAPWGAPLGGRTCHHTVALGDYIYVMGGQNMPGQTSTYHSHSFELPSVPDKFHAGAVRLLADFWRHSLTALQPLASADCWRSADGAAWELVADNLPWAPRCMIGGSAVLDDRMFLIGGGTQWLMVAIAPSNRTAGTWRRHVRPALHPAASLLQ